MRSSLTRWAGSSSPNEGFWHGTNLWEFPGGAVEFGETLEHALVREIAEEYGCEIEVQELLGVVDHIIPDEGQHWVSPMFICRLKNGTPHICEPHKCKEIGWFAIDKIPETKLTIASRKGLESLRRKYAHLKP